MSLIKELTTLDFGVVIIGFFLILFSFKEIAELFGYFKKKFRIKTGKEEDAESFSKRISALEENDKKQNDDINNILSGVKDIQIQLTNDRIENYRYKILEFASSIAGQRKFNKEAYERIFDIYDLYEIILKTNGRSNGLVDESIEFIRDQYQKRLRDGFDY